MTSDLTWNSPLKKLDTYPNWRFGTCKQSVLFPCFGTSTRHDDGDTSTNDNTMVASTTTAAALPFVISFTYKNYSQGANKWIAKCKACGRNIKDAGPHQTLSSTCKHTRTGQRLSNVNCSSGAVWTGLRLELKDLRLVLQNDLCASLEGIKRLSHCKRWTVCWLLWETQNTMQVINTEMCISQVTPGLDISVLLLCWQTQPKAIVGLSGNSWQSCQQ